VQPVIQSSIYVQHALPIHVVQAFSSTSAAAALAAAAAAAWGRCYALPV
jgi:hypothetical protein